MNDIMALSDTIIDKSLRKQRKKDVSELLKQKYEGSGFDWSKILDCEKLVNSYIKKHYSSDVQLFDITDISVLQDLYFNIANPNSSKMMYGAKSGNKDRLTLILCYQEFLSLKCIDSQKETETVSKGFNEGSVQEVENTKYERDPRNRKACIDHYGWQCSACGLDLAKKYGEIGKNFIEVHHVVPLSEVKENHTVDPIKDLRPLCPNCHAMIHKIKPIITVEEFSKLISDGYKIINNMD